MRECRAVSFIHTMKKGAFAMRFLFRRFAVMMAVILALTVLLVGSSLVDARAKQVLTGTPSPMVQWYTGRLHIEN